jgi:hypothetical protein
MHQASVVGATRFALRGLNRTATSGPPNVKNFTVEIDVVKHQTENFSNARAGYRRDRQTSCDRDRSMP